MELLKVLTPIMACIILTSNISSDGNCNHSRKVEAKMEDSNLIFKSGERSVVFLKNEYSIIVDEYLIDVLLLDTNKIYKIIDLKNPDIELLGIHKKILAKGNPIDRSVAPKGCNYSYAIDDKGSVVFFKKNTIYLLPIK